MPSDLLSIALPAVGQPHHHPLSGHPTSQLVSLDHAQRDALARLYLASYPPQVGAENFADARREIDATFAGEFGAVRPDASRLAQVNGKPAGAVLVVERSIWDERLDGPFIIDLFVHPAMRGLGVGRSLVLAALTACESAGDERLSLRIGDGTSAAAQHLYDSFGFTSLFLE